MPDSTCVYGHSRSDHSYRTPAGRVICRVCQRRWEKNRRVVKSAEERFWEKVKKTDGCWLWTGGRQGSGYGNFAPTRTTPTGAHRYSYELHHGPIPAGFFVCHTCDNPLCVRPDHLWAGPPRANSRDMSRKGRFAATAAKLQPQQVEEIRRRARPGLFSALAREFGVTVSTVSSIYHRKTWRRAG